MTGVLLAQAAGQGGADTGVIVAVITAAGLVVAAVVSLFGLRLGARLDAIEKNQTGLGAAIERLERRMEEGLARLADRIDRLYEPSGPATRQMRSESVDELDRVDPEERARVAQVIEEMSERWAEQIRKAMEGNKP